MRYNTSTRRIAREWTIKQMYRLGRSKEEIVEWMVDDQGYDYELATEKVNQILSDLEEKNSK